MDAAAPPAVLGAVRRAVAGALANPEELDRHPAHPTIDPDADDARIPACVAFAEQFVIDVAAIDDEQRGALGAAMGDATFPFAAALYVTDVFQRARIALARGIEHHAARGDPRAVLNDNGRGEERHVPAVRVRAGGDHRLLRDHHVAADGHVILIVDPHALTDPGPRAHGQLPRELHSKAWTQGKQRLTATRLHQILVDEATNIDDNEWKIELESQKSFYDQFGDKMPRTLELIRQKRNTAA